MSHVPLDPTLTPAFDKLRWFKSCVKLSKGCQVAKEVSNVKKSITWTMEEVHKKYIDIMRFTDIDVNFDVTYDGGQKPLKCA